MMWVMQNPILFLLISCSLSFAVQTGTPRKVLCADDSKQRLAVVNGEGKIEWEYKVGPIHAAHVLPNGNFLFQVNWSRVIEVTFDEKKEIVWEYDASKRPENAGKHVEVHAFQRLENGDTMIAESGSSRILEVSKDGTITKQFSMKVSASNGHSDTRQVVKLKNGHYLAAHEHDGMVREYDAQGKVVWEYAVPLFDRKPAGGHGPEAFGNAVFGVQRLENGNTLIGTGNGHSVIEVTPKGEIVWKIAQHDLAGIELAWVCSVERLANGNTRFVNCHAGPNNPQLIEVDKNKKLVWAMKDFDNFGNSTPVAQVIESP